MHTVCMCCQATQAGDVDQPRNIIINIIYIYIYMHVIYIYINIYDAVYVKRNTKVSKRKEKTKLKPAGLPEKRRNNLTNQTIDDHSK